MAKILHDARFVLLTILILGLAHFRAAAVSASANGVTINYTENADGSITVVNAYNKQTNWVEIYVDNDSDPVRINGMHNGNAGSAPVNKTARRKVGYRTKSSSGAVLWTPKAAAPRPEAAPATTAAPAAEQPQAADTKPEATQPQPQGAAAAQPHAPAAAPTAATPVVATGTMSVAEQINLDTFFGQDAVSAFTRKCGSLADGIAASPHAQQFITDNDIRIFLAEADSELEARKSDIPALAADIVMRSGVSDASQASMLKLVMESLDSRWNTRREAADSLRKAVDDADASEGASAGIGTDSIVNYLVVGVVLLLVLWLIVAIVKKQRAKGRRKAKPEPYSVSTTAPDGTPNIVVRRRTTSILKRQCIDDVVDNPAYLKIDTAEFSADSAVRRIYIKNSCIKDVYNLYADDLRNSDNPKEDGCMVLGRWVCDPATHTYDVALEIVVFPGDDAIFKEYELNFGGKIKLRIAEKLRKLRRDTNLQYDLVCWIHSHPGLGVFFSNSDDNVQAQLKHSQHPNFLVAFVVDILTTNQDMGIFTFRRDGSMNSKNDITHLYSLESMYKWALESEKASFSPENFYNVLGHAGKKLPECSGIELNNSSIIDLTRLAEEPAGGIVGWAVGTTIANGPAREHVVSGIVRADGRPGTGVLGAVLNVTHFSLPTIQRLIAQDASSLSFVLVYSTRQMSITAIPVVAGEVLTDERYYGEETIDDLKIWTRRKR